MRYSAVDGFSFYFRSCTDTSRSKNNYNKQILCYLSMSCANKSTTRFKLYGTEQTKMLTND